MLLTEVKQEEDTFGSAKAKGEEWLRLEDYETLGEKLSEIQILQVCMSGLGHEFEKTDDIQSARDQLAEILIVELSKKEWGNPECQEAIQKEIANMKNYGVFGEKIKGRLGLEIVGTRLILTKSQKQDGQKKKIKARMVAQGFGESEKSQSDSPTAHRESMRLFLAICAMLGFVNLSSIDITGAYLQS